MYGIRIRELRKEKGLSQKDLAKILNVDFRTISFWETERYEPNISQLKELCDFFNVCSDYVIGRQDWY
ncbi:MAG: helix-turn-helix transcriptional regulator [Clostridia bacterium]|nr:helix-turn-helix transcriptional regulator [Clostridia bacterium]